MFYIATVGSTASVWFARALNMHPEINCFHGVSSLFPRTPQTPRQFIDTLNYLYFNSEGHKVFGAVHGLVGRETKPEIDAIGGAFAVMSRHPIQRVNSMFHREVHAQAHDPASQNLFRIDPASWGDIFHVFHEGRSPPELEPHVRKAYIAGCATVREDMWILDSVDERQIFRYERFVAEPEYFRSCFEYIVEGCRNAMRRIEFPMMRNVDWTPGSPRLECSDDYLAAVFQMGRVNDKTVSPKSTEDIFAKWPDLLKATFAMALANFGGPAVLQRYATLGYPLPEYFETILSTETGRSFEPLLAAFPTLPAAFPTLPAAFPALPATAASTPAAPISVAETPLAAAPKPTAPGYSLLDTLGLNITTTGEKGVLEGQEVVRITAASHSRDGNNRHFLALQIVGLKADQTYRITGWVKAGPRTNIALQARDHPDDDHPRNNGIGIFAPASNQVLATEMRVIGAGIMIDGASEWKKIWIDLPTSDGRFAVIFFLLDGANYSFAGDSQYQIIFGGIEAAPQP